MTGPHTYTLEVAGAVVRYDVRDVEGESTTSELVMIAFPMDASGFSSLVEHFQDRTVVTYDPRGVSRSEWTDGVSGSTPDERADDVHRLISAIDAGPVDVFASSGGAVDGLALVARHPEQLERSSRTNHPRRSCSPTANRRWRRRRDPRDLRAPRPRAGDGEIPHAREPEGRIPADFADQPGPDPADLGLPRERRYPPPAHARATSSRPRTTSTTSTRCARPGPGS